MGRVVGFLMHRYSVLPSLSMGRLGTRSFRERSSLLLKRGNAVFELSICRNRAPFASLDLFVENELQVVFPKMVRRRNCRNPRKWDTVQ